MTKHVTEQFNIIYGYKCNYACVGCSNGSDQISSRTHDPDLATTLKAIEILPDILHIPPGGMITLLGGEIFMYWQDTIIPLIKSLRQSFPTTTINLFSNAHFSKIMFVIWGEHVLRRHDFDEIFTAKVKLATKWTKR